MRLPVPSLLASCLALACLAAPAALAQSVMTPGTMPPPPSASEPRPRVETAKERPTRPARRAKKTAEDAPLRTPPASAGSSCAHRVSKKASHGHIRAYRPGVRVTRALRREEALLQQVLVDSRPGLEAEQHVVLELLFGRLDDAAVRTRLQRRR